MRHLPQAIRLQDTATMAAIERVREREGFTTISAAARALIYRGMGKTEPGELLRGRRPKNMAAAAQA